MGDLVQIGDLNLTLTLFLTLTLPDLNLTIFPSIPCLVSGRRSEAIIILELMQKTSMVDRIKSFTGVKYGNTSVREPLMAPIN